MLSKKKIVIGIHGSIAVYNAVIIVSGIKKLNSKLQVIMTKSAIEFINPLTFMSLSQNPVVTDMFEEPKNWETEHIAIAKAADLFLIAPASANFIGKMVSGIADDMLTTTVMATKAPVIIAPAMNTNMYLNKIVQSNIDKLKQLGYEFISPASGRLACGDEGVGKLAPVENVINEVVEKFTISNDLQGKKILITAGPTRESIDPVRFITNHSSGKMGYAIAEAAIKRGAVVTLISGPVNINRPNGINKYIEIQSAEDMYNEVINNYKDNDIIIKSAAVADYRPDNYSENKIKKKDDDLIIKLTRNNDILREIGMIKENRILVGFAAETNNIMENADKKLREKNLDLIVVNDIMQEGAGFNYDTNIVKIINKNGTISEYPIMSKLEIANILLDEIVDSWTVDSRQLDS